MEDILNKYVNGEINFTPIANIIFNSNIDIYEDIGKYLFMKFSGSFPEPLSIFNKTNKSGIKSFLSFKKDRSMSSLGIMFLTSTLSEDVLKTLYGRGIKHSKFGEGFDKKRKYTIISTFIKKNGYTFHIGVDHRGTSIETERIIPPKELLECLRQIVDDYVELFK